MYFLHSISSFKRRATPVKRYLRYSCQFFYFLLFCINFYSSYYFLCLFGISFNIYLKKYFCHKFFFFNKFTKTLQPLNAELSKSAKHDESFFLMFLNYNRSYLAELPNLIQFSSSFILHLIVNDCHCLVAGYPIL